ncbi:hypothetical protein [Thermopirellula anaerolimosa]
MAGDDLDGQGLAAAFQGGGQLETTDIVRPISEANDGPLNACTRFSPEKSGPTGRAAFQVLAGFVGDVGILMRLVEHVQADNRRPGNAGITGDLACGDWLQQDGESPPMLRSLGNHSVYGRLAFEGLEVVGGRDDRRF